MLKPTSECEPYMPLADAFSQYQTLTGGVEDEATGLLSITPAQFANLQSLFFNINGVTFEFTANAQIWPVRPLFCIRTCLPPPSTASMFSPLFCYVHLTLPSKYTPSAPLVRAGSSLPCVAEFFDAAYRG